MLDIKPASGHRMLIQSYPGGIESGTDWYQNDAGMVLTETTIDQTPFNARGTPVAFRARMAIQYGSNIDDVARILSTQNNGLYTNEWIMGDAKTNEIAIFDLGTNHTKLWRSSKNEWFGGTPGFYWGDNNAKDLNVRLEELSRSQGRSGVHPLCPRAQETRPGSNSIKVSRPDRRAVWVPGLSHRTAGRRLHHGCEGGHRGHGLAHDGLGRDRPAQPAGMAAQQKIRFRRR